MSFVASAIIGAGTLGAGASIYGSMMGANAQKSATNSAINAQEGMFQQAQSAIQPYSNFGQSLMPTLQSLLTPGPNQNATLQNLPGYQFNFTQGEKGVTNQATMSGLSGNALTAGANYASGLANSTFFPYLSALQGGVSTGSSAASSLGGLATSTGSSIGSNITGLGNAQAASNIGIGNAVGSLGSTIGNTALLNSLSGNKLFGGPSGLNGSVNQYANSGSSAQQLQG